MVFMIQLAAFCIYDICKRLLSPNKAIFALGILAVFLPYYIMPAFFYTDGLTVLFPALIYNLYLRINDRDNRTYRIVIYALIGLFAAFGMIIKFTVVIMLIAICIQALLRMEIKKAATMIGCSVFVTILTMTLMSSYMYATVLSREGVAIYGVPRSHLIAMSMQKNGEFNNDDRFAIQALPDRQARHEYSMVQLSERIREQGVRGMATLMRRKTVNSFGNGTYMMGDFIRNVSVNPGALHEWVLPHGENHSRYSYISQGTYLAMFLLMIISVRSIIIQKRWSTEELAPYLSFFGLWLFLMMWETAARYTLNFMPLLLIMAIMGSDAVDFRKDKKPF